MNQLFPHFEWDKEARQEKLAPIAKVLKRTGYMSERRKAPTLNQVKKFLRVEMDCKKKWLATIDDDNVLEKWGQYYHAELEASSFV